jgi:pimeloyl-ACP methyl ester carboxylesterase
MTNPLPPAQTGDAGSDEYLRRSTPVAPWPGEFVELADGELFVRTAPAPAGAQSAVFVHGLGGSALNWTDLMDRLAKPASGHREVAPLRCLAVDLPGFGFSAAPANGDYSVDARAAAVAALIETCGNAPVHLVGNSLGGAICTRLAARRPDLVATLTLVSPALPDLRPRLLPYRLAVVAMPGVGRWLLNRLKQMPPSRRADMTINDIFADPSLMEPERRYEAISEVIRRDGLGYAGEAMLGSVRAVVAEYTRAGPGSLWRDAASVTAPTLVIYGSHDRLVDPSLAGRAARAFANCRVVVLPKTGHVAMMERPGLVADEMREFIASSALRASGDGRDILDGAVR